jgi:hypothetical protein
MLAQQILAQHPPQHPPSKGMLTVIARAPRAARSADARGTPWQAGIAPSPNLQPQCRPLELKQVRCPGPPWVSLRESGYAGSALARAFEPDARESVRIRLQAVRLLQIASQDRIAAVPRDGLDRRQVGAGLGRGGSEPVAKAVPRVAIGLLLSNRARHALAHQVPPDAALDDGRDRLRVRT